MRRRTDHLRGALLAAGGAACLSPDGLILHLVAADAWQASFWRMLSYAGAMLLLVLARGGRDLAQARRSLGVPGLLTGTLFASSNIFIVLAFTHTSVAHTLVILATEPLFGTVLGLLFLGERVKPRTLVVIAIGIGCIAAIFADRLGEGSTLGDVYAVLAALSFAGNLTVARRHPELPLLLPFAFGGALAAAVSAIPSPPLAAPSPDVALLVASGALQQPAAFFLFISGAHRLPPAEVSLLSLVETVLGPLWVWLALGERPSSVSLIAGGVVIVALISHSWLGLRAERRGAGAPAVPRAGPLG